MRAIPASPFARRWQRIAAAPRRTSRAWSARAWVGSLLVLLVLVGGGGALKAAEVAPSLAPQTFVYGTDPLQALDFWRSQGVSGGAPLVVFVHGGGWQAGDKRGSLRSSQRSHFLARGYAFASVNYRLMPAVDVETQAVDVAMALKYLRDQAPQLGVDPRRIVLMGHSASAHLAALVGTDGRYLEKAGVQFGDLAGIVLLDGAGYDVAAQLEDAGPRLKRLYRAAFGTDVSRQRALSPTAHAAAPNAPAFLILHVERPDSARQSRALGAALSVAGTRVEIHGLPGRGLAGHLEINVELGDPDYAGTAIVDRWLGTLWR